MKVLWARTRVVASLHPRLRSIVPLGLSEVAIPRREAEGKAEQILDAIGPSEWRRQGGGYLGLRFAPPQTALCRPVGALDWSSSSERGSPI